MDIKQPKTLVVFFSRSGHTRRVAHSLAQHLNADLEELSAVQSRDGPIGYAQSALEAMLTLAPAIERPHHDGSGHELFVIGTPVWFWSLASPVRTWLLQAKLQHARVAFFCTMGGSGASRVFDAMTALAGHKPVSTLEISEHEVDAHHSNKLDAFVHALQNSQLPATRKTVRETARPRKLAARASTKAKP
jgi:flavodoxin